MAILGKPAKTAPNNARLSSNREKFGVIAVKMERIEATKSAIDIICLRPMELDKLGVKSITMAKTPVEKESDKLAFVGDTPNSLENIGIKGWAL